MGGYLGYNPGNAMHTLSVALSPAALPRCVLFPSCGAAQLDSAAALSKPYSWGVELYFHPLVLILRRQKTLSFQKWGMSPKAHSEELRTKHGKCSCSSHRLLEKQTVLSAVWMS